MNNSSHIILPTFWYPRMTLCCALLMLGAALVVQAAPPEPTRTPLMRVVDLAIGESAELTLADGGTTTIRLLDVTETRDSVRGAVRVARVRVAVNGEETTLTAGNYNLPQTVGGTQIDCSITRGYTQGQNRDVWGLEKDARLRLWPAGSPWIAPGTFVYPLKQRWFATLTQMANEPVYVNASEDPKQRDVYYHNDLDFGGSEGLIEVVVAAAGEVVSVAGKTLPGYEDAPVNPRYDVVYIRDDRGWYYRYSHLQVIDPAIKPGAAVRLGQQLGVLGKEGASGGWSHLHFGIVSRQPSGKWGTQEAYAFAWEAYLRQYHPQLIAVARPHHFVAVGEKVELDGSKSWSAETIVKFQWQFTDGTTASGPKAGRTYRKPGSYSEILKITDAAGRVAYDFAVVQVVDPTVPGDSMQALHPTYAPTVNLRSGDPITFKVRSFGRDQPGEIWDFGDGSPRVTVHSDGNANPAAKDGYAVTRHTYETPGLYLVRVEQTSSHGHAAVAHLAVEVGVK